MMFHDAISSRPVLDMPVDAGDDGVVVTESAKTLRIGTLVIADLAEGFVIVFAVLVINALISGMIGVGMLYELGVVHVSWWVLMSC